MKNQGDSARAKYWKLRDFGKAVIGAVAAK